MKKSPLSDANETQARQYLAVPHTPFSKLTVCVCVCNNENQESGWSQGIRPRGLNMQNCHGFHHHYYYYYYLFHVRSLYPQLQPPPMNSRISHTIYSKYFSE